MKILQIDLANKKQVRDFLELPFHIYKDIPQWVPPFQDDARLQLNPKRHPFYQHSQAAFFLAVRNGLPVGRLAVIDHRPYNQFNHTKTAFFYLFECENVPDAAHGLFESAFGWARQNGLEQVMGPKGFTPLDGFGLLVRGFEHRPALGIPYNPDYYPTLIETAGFTPYGEAVSGYLGKDIQFPERLHELSERIQQRRGIHIARYKTRADLRAFIPKLKELYNGALEGTTDTYPISDADVDNMAGQILWFADPTLIKVVMKDDRPVGFLLAYPDISVAIQKTHGRLWPFGWWSILRALKSTDWININGAGLLPEYRGSGGTAILFSEMFKSVRESGQFRHADLVQVGVENDKMQRELRDLGIDFYKLHRVYKRNL